MQTQGTDNGGKEDGAHMCREEECIYFLKLQLKKENTLLAKIQ